MTANGLCLGLGLKEHHLKSILYCHMHYSWQSGPWLKTETEGWVYADNEYVLNMQNGVCTLSTYVYVCVCTLVCTERTIKYLRSVCVRVCVCVCVCGTCTLMLWSRSQ